MHTHTQAANAPVAPAFPAAESECPPPAPAPASAPPPQGPGPALGGGGVKNGEAGSAKGGGGGEQDTQTRDVANWAKEKDKWFNAKMTGKQLVESKRAILVAQVCP